MAKKKTARKSKRAVTKTPKATATKTKAGKTIAAKAKPGKPKKGHYGGSDVRIIHPSPRNLPAGTPFQVQVWIKAPSGYSINLASPQAWMETDTASTPPEDLNQGNYGIWTANLDPPAGEFRICASAEFYETGNPMNTMLGSDDWGDYHGV